jgi:hypothetical protein
MLTAPRSSSLPLQRGVAHLIYWPLRMGVPPIFARDRITAVHLYPGPMALSRVLYPSISDLSTMPTMADTHHDWSS